jgi:RLL motif-containing protein 1
MENLLSSLECPFIESLKFNLKSNIIRLVCWLEDLKIRELDIDDRKCLRKNDELWDNEFNIYLTKLGCPFTFNWPEESNDCIFWLISLAISKQYDDVNELNESELLSEKISTLGDIIDLNRLFNESDIDYLDRIQRKIYLFLTDDAIQGIRANNFSLADFPLGFDTGDKIVNSVSLVLRMLYLVEFRELQSDVNDLIVAGQELTANPRVNSSLGRVGR